ncbi:MAG: hypothetical protein HOO06_10425 [Bdellovibrionaceae bacterium]|jgi:TolA-binding protein|nr:hypothetical protein [Pseudobdellovibrionaceae bacterium]
MTRGRHQSVSVPLNRCQAYFADALRKKRPIKPKNIKIFQQLADKPYMKSQVFIVFCLTIAVGTFQAFKVFETHFSGLNELKREKSILQAHIEHKELQYELASYKLLEMQNDVALAMNLIPKKDIKSDQKYPLRRLASVTQTSLSPGYLMQLAKRHFLKGKKLFRAKRYDEANIEFTKVIKEYSYSVHVTESYFLLIEGLYQSHRYEELIGHVDKMVSLYPESELTGYSMLRLGKIFEYQDRQEEASGLYKTIMQSFKEHDVVRQARISLRAIQI